MVRINLLKDQQRSERRNRRRSKVELCVGVFGLAAVFTCWGWVVVDGSQAIQQLEQAIQDKQGRLGVMTQHQDRVLTLQEQRNTVLTEHATLEALTRDIDRPIRLLSVINRIVDPLDVWLRQLRASDEKVTLSGVALSRDGILQLAKELKKTDMLGAVNVFEIQAHSAQPDLFRFSMNISMDSVDHGTQPS